MSDSENDLLPSNVYTFQNENTMISAKGPSVNNTNMTNISFRNNVLTSTMHMSRNFERQRFAEPSFDQRSMYSHRRETSPMSMYSGSDMRVRNLHQSYYGGMSSQRSMYYGRSGSPMSMRSMDSNASVSAVDIALAFKNVNFNKHDMRMIKDAYNKFMKRRIRKKIEKRRNMRLFLKGYRRKSGYDSGEQGSDSSISSDDCKSTSSAFYKDNMSCRSTRTDITDFRRTIRESNMYRDCTDSFKQNAFKNMFSVPSAPTRDRFNNHNAMQVDHPLPQKEFAVPNAVQKPAMTQKDRFRTGYLLPSQRFNKSVASVPILERDPRLQVRQNAGSSESHKNNETQKLNGHVNCETDSDAEEIFSEVTVREKSGPNCESQYDKITDQGKRGLDIADSNKGSDRKRPKLSSPLKQPNKANALLKEKNTNMKNNKKSIAKPNTCNEEENKEQDQTECVNNINSNEFEFLKPQFPIRKSGPTKTKEKLISKSAQPLSDEIIPLREPVPVETIEVSNKNKAPELDIQQPTNEDQPNNTQHSNSDLSMRPSFIKRKLFTQKMDVTERKNLSSGALNVNSPQTNVYSAIQKEKHKARKLVTNQSCLSRDIAQEGNPLLDLIHKIVPPDRMNMTNATNKTSISCSISSKNALNDDDKWDVTSVISTCNNDDVSDTFTDEEIFAVNETKRKVDTIQEEETVKKIKENDKKNNNLQKASEIKRILNVSQKSECRILVEKLPQNRLTSKSLVEVSKPTVPVKENDHNKKSAYNCVKSFWDTDFESDMESPAPKRAVLRSNAVKENVNRSTTIEEYKIPKIKKPVNVSLASVSESIKSKTMPTNNLKLRKFNISKTLSIKSYLTPKQLKSNPKVSKQNPENTVKEATITHENSCNIEPAKDHVIKKLTKQNTKSSENDKDNNKTITKKTNRKRSGDLLDTTIVTIQSQPKAKRTKAQNAKISMHSKVNNSVSGSRTIRTPKRIVCCNEPESDHNRSTRSSAKKSMGLKQMETDKNPGKHSTNAKSIKTVEAASKKKTEAVSKKSNSKKNGDILDTPSKTKQSPPKAATVPSKAEQTKATKDSPNKAKEIKTLKDSPNKAKQTKTTKDSPNKTKQTKTSKVSPNKTRQTKSTKAQSAKPKNKTVANNSLSKSRPVRTPKRKAGIEEHANDNNRSTRSSSKKILASKLKQNTSRSKFN